MLPQTLEIRRRCFDLIKKYDFYSDYFERKIADLSSYGPRGSFFRIKFLIPRIFSMDIYIFASRFPENATASVKGSVIGMFNLTRIYFNVF